MKCQLHNIVPSTLLFFVSESTIESEGKWQVTPNPRSVNEAGLLEPWTLMSKAPAFLAS